MGQLAQEKAERPTRTFGANTEKNPKEECKAVPTRGQKRAQEEGKAEEEDQFEERRTMMDSEINVWESQSLNDKVVTWTSIRWSID